MADTSHAAKFFALGQTCIRQGRVQEGIEAYTSGLGLDPSNPDNWYNLGYLLRCDRRFLEAISAYTQSLAYGVRNAQDVWTNIAIIQFDYLQRADEAIASLTSALAIDPDYLPALLNLGTIHEDQGDSDAAAHAYERALEAQPNNGRALGRLAMVDLARGRGENWVGRLKQALARAGCAQNDRAEIAFALGHILDSLGDYQDAFSAFTTANLAAKHLLGPQARYDARRTEDLVTALITGVQSPISPLTARSGSAPIFIFGMFRSGSTLVEHILGRHPDVLPGGELEIIPATVQKLGTPYPEVVLALDAPACARLRTAYQQELALAGLGTHRTTDKRPDNILYLPLIHALFPDAPLIMTRRHPLDTALSIFFGNFDVGVPYSYDLDDIVHWSTQFERLSHHWASIYGNQILTCDYDALVRNPRPAVEQLLRHCDLTWEEACLANTPLSSSVRTLSNWQVRQPIHTRSSARWRNYVAFLPAHVRALAET